MSGRPVSNIFEGEAEHEPACEQPGWVTAGPPVAGITVVRCEGCGVQILKQPAR